MDDRFTARVEACLPREEPPVLSADQQAALRAEIKTLLQEKQAVLIAHYYVDDAIQALAEETGGIVADSLDMAKFGANAQAQTLVVAGVRFMGETAKILSPEKTVLMPTLAATCSLDLSCQADEFAAFIEANPGREVVVYANTSAEVKALSDWVVTSSIALDVIDHLDREGKRILWAPDRYLGQYLQQQTSADMVLWQGSCVVHEAFKASGVKALKAQHPDAGILVHPESPQAVIDLADCVGSTSQLLAASAELPHQTFIVATDRGIFYKMKQRSPHKAFLSAPTGGAGATCQSCAHCPWMNMNSLVNLRDTLKQGQNEIQVDPVIREKASKALSRMVAFKAQTPTVV